MIIEPIAAQVADATVESTVSDATFVLVTNTHTAADTITLKASVGGSTTATFTVLAGDKLILRKTATQSVTAGAATTKLTKVLARSHS